MRGIGVGRRSGVLLAAMALTLGAGTGAAGTRVAAAGTADDLPVCAGTDLSVGQNRDGYQEGMLQRGVDIVVTNSSHLACTLDGYLDLQLLAADHGPLRTSLTRGDTFFEADPRAAAQHPAAR